MKKLLNELLTTAPKSLLNKLASVPGAIRSPRKRKQKYPDQYVYVPGTLPAEKRVLLVAHVDTVAASTPTPKDLYWRGSLVTNRRGILGADDRAGVAATWLLRGSGHSILWTDGEESGGYGAERAVDCIGEELADHAYAVEIDRAGDQCLAFYYGATSTDWEGWLRRKLPDWKQESGTYTDIATICPAVGICGVNFAAGYLYQHTRSECLFVDALERSVASVRELIKDVPEAHLYPESDLQESYLGWGSAALDDDLHWAFLYDTGDADTPPARFNGAGDRIPS